MKKIAVMGVAIMILLGTLAAAHASYLSYNQRYYFTYSVNSYYAFVYDYSQHVQESATPGFISYDTYLTFYAQYPTLMTTHVAYFYDSSAGRYTEAMATLDQML